MNQSCESRQTHRELELSDYPRGRTEMIDGQLMRVYETGPEYRGHEQVVYVNAPSPAAGSGTAEQLPEAKSYSPGMHLLLGMLGAFYILCPFDICPDIIPVLGWFDDIAVFWWTVAHFKKFFNS